MDNAVRKMMTVAEVNERIDELSVELDYLDVLLDEEVRDRREIYLDAPPVNLRVVLLAERAKRSDERGYLGKSLKELLEKAPVIEAWRGDATPEPKTIKPMAHTVLDGIGGFPK